ncbi:MAG TPA: rRNA maturation RNase YbeY [Geminicoccaceae bacterium]|nr:rRNA maturation RNase YbeY [Geminicoccaceae bacterium]
MDDDRPEPVSVTLGEARWRAVLDDAPALCRQAVRAAVDRAAGVPALAAAEIGVLLADDRAIRLLNARHRGQDRATNVLAFPLLDLDHGRPATGLASPAPLLLGDIALALETVCREAEEAGKPVGDHLRHLVVHGTLHLLGFDHQDAAGARAMEDLERAILAELQVPDPYGPDPHVDGAGRGRGDQHAWEAVR